MVIETDNDNLPKQILNTRLCTSSCRWVYPIGWNGIVWNYVGDVERVKMRAHIYLLMIEAQMEVVARYDFQTGGSRASEGS